MPVMRVLAIITIIFVAVQIAAAKPRSDGSGPTVGRAHLITSKGTQIKKNGTSSPNAKSQRSNSRRTEVKDSHDR